MKQIKHLKNLLVLGFVSILLSGAQALHAQTSPAVSGTVVDSRGQAVQGATVIVKADSNGVIRRSTTDSEGRFSLAGLTAGSYSVEVDSTGFAPVIRKNIQVSDAATSALSIQLSVATVSEEVTVEAEDNTSVAVQLAPVRALLDATSARTEITSQYIREFTTPVTDFTDVVKVVPGTFSVSPNGVGLGSSNTYFRGFSDGNYTIAYDGIPFEDTNDPTHHSWAFFPGPDIGGVDFDRSPGTASDIGPTNFGGSIHLLSPQLSSEQGIKASESYGSFNTSLIQVDFNSGSFGGKNPKQNFWLDANRLTTDGYETNNFVERNSFEFKYDFKLNNKTRFTALSSVQILDSNTPDANAPTRAQVAQNGRNYLMDSTKYLADGTTLDPLYYKYYFYHVPTDFEYLGATSELGHGWKLDEKAYTFSYSNHQHFNNSQTTVSTKSAVDKLNAYNRIGDTLTLSQASRFGVFRTGLWYEHSGTNRAQFKSDPTTWIDVQGIAGIKLHERFWTNSVQPFAEYQYVGIPRLTITAGIKDAYYNMNLKQYADNGHIVGDLGGAAFVTHDAGYNSWLPSIEANYRIQNNWSVYVQFAKGSAIPPSSVFDVTGANVSKSGLPNPALTSTYQAGTVVKLNRVSLDADAYYIRFQNAYSSFTPSSGPNAGISFDYLNPDSRTMGLEAEANIALGHGLSLFLNGTAGNAQYQAGPAVAATLTAPAIAATPIAWVANAPRDTESEGFTYQSGNWDLGFFNKRVGQMWNDNTDADGNPLHQAALINPFSVADIFLNYTVRNHSRFDQSKLKFSVNNLFNDRNLVGVTPGLSGTSAAPYTEDGSDTITLLPVRSFMFTFQLGFGSKGR